MQIEARAEEVGLSQLGLVAVDEGVGEVEVGADPQGPDGEIDPDQTPVGPVHGRLLTLDPEGSYLVANTVIQILLESNVKVVAGPALAAIPIVASVSTISYLQGRPIRGIVIRNEAKKHGMGKIIEGVLEKYDRVAVVDDTCSTGGSLLRAIEQVEESGGKVVKVISILDRHLGGSDLIKGKGYEFITILDADEDGKIQSGIPTI